MSRLHMTIGAVLGGWLGWWLGGLVGIMTAWIISIVGTAAGIYYGGKIARDHFD